MAAIENQVEGLERRALELQPDIGQTAMLAQEILRIKRASESLAEGAGELQSHHLSESVARLEGELKQLRRDLFTAVQTFPVSEPAVVDVRWTLSTAPGRGYASRSLGNIQYIVVEHSATIDDVTPESLAQTHLARGKAAIACHFLVGQKGTIYWTQPLETVVSYALLSDLNQRSIVVSLAGSFNSQAPQASQLEATADLLAWLVSAFRIDPTAIRGRRELEDVPSPGAQWSGATGYKQMLLALVYERLSGYRTSRGDLPQVALQRRHRAMAESAAGSGRVPRPSIVDVVSSLPKHPTLPPYPVRPEPVSVIAIHHTDTLRSATVEQIAQYHVYGVRRYANGQLVKAQWPGIGYHFVIAADGAIYQCQREETRSYHVGGSANDFCLGVSFIGRFMRLGFDERQQPQRDQIPTAAQLQSGGQLIAWLMQEFKVPVEKVMGHGNVVGGTVCPGEHWEAGLKWRALLQKSVQAAMDATPEPVGDQPIEHYLLFWDHGTSWAAGEWAAAQDYIAHFRPTMGFSVQDALQARHVTILGGPEGVSSGDEARLRASGGLVHRLVGSTPPATKALLDALVAQDTPWPGAPPRVPTAVLAAVPSGPTILYDEGAGDPPFDEWTIPDDWEPFLAPAGEPIGDLSNEQAG